MKIVLEADKFYDELGDEYLRRDKMELVITDDCSSGNVTLNLVGESEKLIVDINELMSALDTFKRKAKGYD